MISQSSRHCTVELQALPSRIGQVRRIVSAQLRYWHLDPLIDQAALGVTELLANVHQHAEPDKMCVVDIELMLDRLTVSVHDHDPRIPAVPAAPDEDLFATSGRGLSLIAAVSENWGVQPRGERGKTVWFTLTAPSPAANAAAPPARTAAPPAAPDPLSVAADPPQHPPARETVGAAFTEPLDASAPARATARPAIAH